MEIWKDIKGFEGFYQVSNMGNVKSLDREIQTKDGRTVFYKGQPMKPGKETCGYSFVALTKNNKRVYARVHRLVAAAFMDNKYNKPEVNHIDGNKQNNAVSNLEFSTHSENMQHAVKTGLKKRVHPVEMLDKTTGEILKSFPSINSAVVYLEGQTSIGVWRSIWRCLNGEITDANGFKWKMVKPL